MSVNKDVTVQLIRLGGGGEGERRGGREREGNVRTGSGKKRTLFRNPASYGVGNHRGRDERVAV